MVVIRLSRGGARNRPFFNVVVADSRNRRDGRFIEKVGTYDPMLQQDNPKRVTLVEERIKHWVSVGAQPSERVARFLATAKIGPKVECNETPKKSAPRAKTQERMKLAEAEAKANAAKTAEAEAPAA